MAKNRNFKLVKKILIILVILLFNINLFSNNYVKGNEQGYVNVQPNQINIPLTIRDFKAGYILFEQIFDPDFGRPEATINNQLYYLPLLSEELNGNRLEVTEKQLANGKPVFTNKVEGLDLNSTNLATIQQGNHMQIIQNVTGSNAIDLMAVEIAKHTNDLYRELSKSTADKNATLNKEVIKILDNILYRGYEPAELSTYNSGIKVHFKSPWIGNNYIHAWDVWEVGNGYPWNTVWPGEKMEPSGNGWYTFEFVNKHTAKMVFNANSDDKKTVNLQRDGKDEWWYKDGNWYDYNPDGKENDFNARLGNYNDAKAWYDRIKDKKFTELINLERSHTDAINTAYRYVYLFMNSFFNDFDGINTQDPTAINNLVLTNSGNGVYTFDSGANGFFPMDNKGYGNDFGIEYSKLPDKGQYNHNYHFSVEGHAKFTVPNKTGTFTFTGDDDVWIYINGKKAIDLGGIHEKQMQQIEIRPRNDASGKADVYRIYYQKNGNIFQKNREEKLDYDLDIGKDCNFDIFYMERRSEASNLKIETNLEFRAKVAPEKVAYKIVDGKEVILGDAEIVDKGDTIYYKLIAKNEGNVPIRNVEFVDSKLGIIINQSGATSNNFLNQTPIPILLDKITIITNYEAGKEVDGTSSGVTIPTNIPYRELYYLPPGGTIEIKIPDYLKYVVKDTDVTNGKVDNVLLVKGDVGETGKVGEEVTETVVVGKRDADIVKSIAEIVRSNINIPIDSQLIPGDKVTFKFVITNKSEVTVNGNKQAIELNGLKLTDILKINNDAHQKTNWSFTKDKINEFNVSNFNLVPNEVLELYATWTVTIEESNYYNSSLAKDVINTATLTLPDSNTRTSEVQMKIKPPNFSIQKQVLDKDLSVNNSLANNKSFTIIVKGSDGSHYNIEAKAGTEYILSNLKYGNETEGVRYTVSEIVPMNFTLQSIKVDGVKTDVVMLSGLNKGEVIVSNLKQDDNNFNDDVHVENRFGNYTGTGFSGGVD